LSLSSKIYGVGIRDPRSGIRDKTYSGYPIRVQGKKGTGSWIRNTGFLFNVHKSILTILPNLLSASMPSFSQVFLCYAKAETNKIGKGSKTLYAHIQGASKIKLKKANKKRTVRRVIIFFKFLKASIADLITLLSL
jgi:hypothetical protein